MKKFATSKNGTTWMVKKKKNLTPLSMLLFTKIIPYQVKVCHPMYPKHHLKKVCNCEQDQAVPIPELDESINMNTQIKSDEQSYEMKVMDESGHTCEIACLIYRVWIQHTQKQDIKMLYICDCGYVHHKILFDQEYCSKGRRFIL